MSLFEKLPQIKYEGPKSKNPLAFKYYDAERVIHGKKMKDHLKFAMAWWHNLSATGADMFGPGTADKSFGAEPGTMEHAKAKVDAGFEFMKKLGIEYFCFHDADLVPEGKDLAETNARLDEITDYIKSKMAGTNIKCLWGTANLFSNPRYMNGAGSSNSLDVYCHAAATIKKAIECTVKLGGTGYVFWGGREGYETLLNTKIGQEQDQMGRFLHMVIEHAEKIGFKGQILIEPKPQEPSKHQYDFDVATVYGFLRKYGLETKVKCNIEVGHAFLANHTFEHELALAASLGILGSVDANRNDLQSGWDTDQFPNSVPETTLAFYQILKAGGLNSGGWNFDAKLRRQSIDPADLLHGHIGGLDVLARSLKAAAAIIEDGTYDQVLDARYAGWQGELGKDILGGKLSLADLAAKVDAENINPQPKSGQQEYLENLINRFV